MSYAKQLHFSPAEYRLLTQLNPRRDSKQISNWLFLDSIIIYQLTEIINCHSDLLIPLPSLPPKSSSSSSAFSIPLLTGLSAPFIFQPKPPHCWPTITSLSSYSSQPLCLKWPFHFSRSWSLQPTRLCCLVTRSQNKFSLVCGFLEDRNYTALFFSLNLSFLGTWHKALLREDTW